MQAKRAARPERPTSCDVTRARADASRCSASACGAAPLSSRTRRRCAQTRRDLARVKTIQRERARGDEAGSDARMRGKAKTREGVVVSDKMDKTVVVVGRAPACSTRSTGSTCKRRTTLQGARRAATSCGVGDRVRDRRDPAAVAATSAGRCSPILEQRRGCGRAPRSAARCRHDPGGDRSRRRRQLGRAQGPVHQGARRQRGAGTPRSATSSSCR